MEQNSNTLSKYIESLIGQKVSIILTDYTIYIGILLSIDGLMNLALESCVIYDMENKVLESLNETFIRGNNILTISVDK